jgi:hypothetical protein
VPDASFDIPPLAGNKVEDEYQGESLRKECAPPLAGRSGSSAFALRTRDSASSLNLVKLGGYIACVDQAEEV